MKQNTDQSVRIHPLVEKARVQSQDSPYEIYVGQSGIGTSFSTITSGFPPVSIIPPTPHTLIHLSPTLHSLRN